MPLYKFAPQSSNKITVINWPKPPNPTPTGHSSVGPLAWSAHHGNRDTVNKLLEFGDIPINHFHLLPTLYLGGELDGEGLH